MSTIEVKIGNMFTSNAQTLVNTVNCVGVMGKGIALEFKNQFPNMYKDYVRKCEQGLVKLGEPYLYKDLFGKWVLNFPTKDHWRSVSKLSDIVAGLEYLKRHYKEWGVVSLAVPPLGCGNGQLDWNVVGPTLYRHFSDFTIPVEMYAPPGTPATQLTHEFLSGSGSHSAPIKSSPDDIRIAASAVALVGILSRITREAYHWPIGRTTFQKIAYFATESGLPTGLQFKRGSFGPFTPDLKRIATRLVNNGLMQETKKGNMFVVEPGPTYLDARQRYMAQLKEWAPLIERIADLFLRLQKTADAEIAATVHFVTTELAKDDLTEEHVFEEVKEWKSKRSPPLHDDEIAETIRYLNALGWINVVGSDSLNVRVWEEVC